MLHHVVQGTGEPTVWLHGLLSTGLAHWQGVLGDVAGHHFLPDLLEHGQSPKDGSSILNPPQQNVQALAQ